MSRQNVYDDEAFFAGYQELRDAESGLNAAVEQPALRALLPGVAGRTVLDLGCGDGALARDLAAGGAARVLAWFVDEVVKYHRRVSTIVTLVLAGGLELRAVTEPVPTPAALAARPDLDRHNRHPAILALAAVRPGG